MQGWKKKLGGAWRRVRRLSRQRGIAIVAVMGLASVVAVMAAHVVVLSQTAAMEALVSAERNRLRYVCESAADYAFWALLNDRREFSNRSYTSEPPDPGEEGVRWQTFGPNRTHRLTYTGGGWIVGGNGEGGQTDTARVTLANADKGIDFGGLSPGAELRLEVDKNADDPTRETESEAIRILLDIARDYADRNDQLCGPHGMEREDYEQWGFAGFNLPRNAPIQYAEEVYWYLGLCDDSPVAEYRDTMRRILLDQGGPRILPPLTKGYKWPKQSVFSASPRQLQVKGVLEPEQVQQVIEALRTYETDRTPLETLLSAEIMGKLRAAFLLGETDVVTFTVEAKAEAIPDLPITVDLRVTRSCKITQRGTFADKKKQSWLLWGRSFRRDPFARRDRDELHRGGNAGVEGSPHP